MKALYLDQEVTLRTDYPVPVPKPNEALIRVSAAGICRTDIEVLKGYMGFKGVLGHEFVGTVEKTQNKQWIGKRVTGTINITCGECIFCHNNMPNHCSDRKVIGLSGHDGCFAEYISLPIANLHLVPDEISDAEATFIEPLAACFQVLEQVHLHPNGNVVILGAGRLGLLMAQVMKLHGNEVSVVGKHPEKLAVARDLGLKAYLATEIRERSKTVIECTGRPEGLQLAQRLVIPRGRIILKSTYHQQTAVDISPFVVNEIELIGSRCGPFRPAINALERKYVNTSSLISGRFPLSQGLAALKAAADSANLKILLDMG